MALDTSEMIEAKLWVTQELNRADVNIKYLEDADPRGVGDLDNWRRYRRDLRDYVKDGIIADERPTL